jgi:hypothetical protein
MSRHFMNAGFLETIAVELSALLKPITNSEKL